MRMLFYKEMLIGNFPILTELKKKRLNELFYVGWYEKTSVSSIPSSPNLENHAMCFKLLIRPFI